MFEANLKRALTAFYLAGEPIKRARSAPVRNGD